MSYKEWPSVEEKLEAEAVEDQKEITKLKEALRISEEEVINLKGKLKKIKDESEQMTDGLELAAWM